MIVVQSLNQTDKAYLIANSVLDEIKSTLRLPEMGGILGSSANNIVTDYYHDITGYTTARNYTPDIDTLNNVIFQWHLRGIEFVGFVHSHSVCKKTLSLVDIRYAEKIKSCCGLTEILMLLFIPNDQSFHQYIIQPKYVGIPKKRAWVIPKLSDCRQKTPFK